MPGVIAEAVTGLKGVSLPISGRSPTFWDLTDYWNAGSGGRLPGERDYSLLVGDGSDSTLVGATVGWIARQFPEAPPVVTSEGDGDIRQIVRRHPAAELLRRPTWDPVRRRSWYSGALLRAALISDFWLDGNAYALKVRDRQMRVRQLWWVPSYMLEPRGSSDRATFIDHYEYRVGGQMFRIDPSEVWHVRQGIDHQNPLKGRSQLKTALREIYTDEMAAWFTASILKNSGRPGVIIMPRNDSKMAIPEPAREAIKIKFTQTFSGDNAGTPMVFGQPTELKEFGFTPDQLKLGEIRDLPEDRVTAITGVPRAILFDSKSTGVGAKYKELREQAAESNLIPTWRLFGEEYDGQVLPDFASDRELEVLQTGFDLRNVGALQDIELKKAEVASRLVSAGLAMVDEGRARVGLPPLPNGAGQVFRPQPGVQGSDPAPVEEPAAA